MQELSSNMYFQVNFSPIVNFTRYTITL